jgi:cell division protein FtsZ
VEAAEMAISSPLLEASIDGAHGVLLSISGGSDLGLFEINEAAQLVSEAAHAEANIIFGAVIDDALGDEVRVTVIAAGFDGGTPRRAAPTPSRRAEPSDQPTRTDANGTTFERSPARAERAVAEPETERGAERSPERVAEPAYSGAHRGDGERIDLQRDPAHAARPSRTIVFDDNDDLDVPEFLR